MKRKEKKRKNSNRRREEQGKKIATARWRNPSLFQFIAS
jgi:hypothetical protein